VSREVRVGEAVGETVGERVGERVGDVEVLGEPEPVK